MGKINQNLPDISALTALLETAPDALLDRLRRAGLPDIDAWNAFRALDGTGKTVVCTLLDGDLESRAARYLLERQPGSVLTGLFAAVRAVGATRAVAVVPPGFCALLAPPESLKNELKSRFSIAFEVTEMPASLVAGEATALLRFLEGRQAIPYLRQNGAPLSLNGNSALVIPAEKLAQAAAALLAPDDLESAFGTAIVTLDGAVKNPCTVEVPLGTTLGALLRDAGGTPVADIKAVRLGGPAGLLLGAGVLDTTALDRTLLENHGFGPLLLEVIPNGACAVETARDALRVLHAESCGKCVFCREGTLHLAALLDDIAAGEGRMEDLEQMEELGRQMRTGCICALGRWAAEPVLGGLRLFREDFRMHIMQKMCTAVQTGGEVDA